MCEYHSGDPRVHHGDPAKVPVLLIDRKRWESPEPTVNLVHDGLHQCSNRVVLIEADSVIMTDNLATIHYPEIDRVIGCLSVMAEVDEALRTTFTL